MPLLDSALADAVGGPPRYPANHRQHVFREFASVIYMTTGSAMVADWISYQHYDYLAMSPKPPVTMVEYRLWEDSDGFIDWVFEAFPDLSEPTQTELEAAGAIYFRRIVAAMSKGEKWAFAQFGRIRELALKATEADKSSDPESLMEFWLQDESGWAKPPTLKRKIEGSAPKAKEE